MLVLLPCRDQWSVQQWSCGPLLLWTVLCYGIVHKSPFCHAFQAVVAADPAHILRRGSHGSAVCHCWLNVEDCTLRTPSNTKTPHGEGILPEHHLIWNSWFKETSSWLTLSSTKPVTHHLFRRLRRFADWIFIWTLSNVPNLNVGRFVWTADNHITFIWLLQAAGVMGYPSFFFCYWCGCCIFIV